MSTPQNGDTHLHGPVAVVSSGNAPIVVQLPCPGLQQCPHRQDPESKQQAEFYRDTGIWAPPEARVVLEQLMSGHGFTAPRLKRAWQASNLKWDDQQKRLLASAHWIEAAGSYFFILILSLYYLLISWMLMSAKADDWRIAIAFLVSCTFYLGMMWVVLHFLLIPYRVGKKAKDLLHPPATTPECSHCVT